MHLLCTLYLTRFSPSVHLGVFFAQVLLTVHAELLDTIPFFCGRHPQFLAQILQHLQLEYYEASEYVMWEGDHSTEMYFVSEGILEVRVRVPSHQICAY
jgi:CRP-like cAMP-binding protein